VPVARLLCTLTNHFGIQRTIASVHDKMASKVKRRRARVLCLWLLCDLLWIAFLIWRLFFGHRHNRSSDGVPSFLRCSGTITI
jgi:hypothetical protein